MRIEFKCKQCGKCCRKYIGTLKATSEDIERWRREGREDILKYVDIYEFDGKTLGGDLWFNPKTGEEMRKCPFLRKRKGKFFCLIHSTKPEVCREYPLLVNAKTLQERLKECGGMKLVKETEDDVRFWEIISEGRKVFKI